MQKISAKFAALKAKYAARRDRFKQIIESSNKVQTIFSSNTVYKKGSALLEQADRLVQEITTDLASITDTKLVAGKVKSFKGICKDLHEITKPWWRQLFESIFVALALALILRNFVFGLYHVPTGSAETNILVGDRLWGNKMAYLFGGEVKRGELVIFDSPLFDFDRSNSFKYYWQKYVGIPVPLLGLGWGPDNWVKRVIAIPGDTIEGRLEDGRTVVYLNGAKLEERYVNRLPLVFMKKHKGFIPFKNIGPIPLPSFLTKQVVPVKYSYDPEKPFEQQPFYVVDPQDVVCRPGTQQPWLIHAFTPTRDDYGRCVDVFGPFVVPPGKYWVMGDSRKNSVDSRWWLFLDQELIHGRASFIIYSIDSEEPFWLFELIKHPIDFWTKYVRWSRFFQGLPTHEIK
jgi:signal peptidase I